MESIIRGNIRERKTDSRRGRKTEWEAEMVATTLTGTWGEGQAKGEKSSTGIEQWIKDEREESRGWIYCDPAVLLFCFFFCWHSEHVGSRQRFFYRSHATSQWSMDAGPLQTYTVEHALCGSAKRGHLGERGRIPPLAPALTIYPRYCSLTHHATLCMYFFSQLLFLLISPTLTESLLKMVKGNKGLTVARVYTTLLRPVNVLVSLNTFIPILMIWLFLALKIWYLKIWVFQSLMYP